MSLTRSKIHVTKRSQQSIFISGALARKLNLKGKKNLKLQLGPNSIYTSLKTIKRKGNHLYIPLALQNAMRVPRFTQVYVRSDSSGNVKIGPLVGIITSATGNMSRPFGSRTALIRQYLSVGNGKAFYFAFTPSGINWQNETVVAYFPNSEGGWSRKIVPLPDVVYNRLPSRKADASASMESLKQNFVRRNIPFFNWSFFNKSDVYRLLEDEPEFYKHVPESVTNPSPEKIKELLEKHRFLYLKPTGGSLGQGIYRLTYHPQRGYYLRFRRGGQNVLLRYRKFSSLVAALKIKRGKLRSYIAQQGIRLIEIDGCPIDFRFHINKNKENQWVVTAVGAKKAGKGSVTTHLRNGGQLLTPEQALGQVFGSRSGEVLSKSKAVAIRLAEAIEKNYKHHIGELGFDFGIDKNENIWMFEANSKPGRSIFKHPGLKEAGRQALVHVFEHCLYLAGFRNRGNGS
ncbi:YheC/YheD family protein [Paenibacillus turpanensis]|uniref:YheC/YheD family endospore coat-associated protein n=1 Tax=Paenibacillus turpanensis TaxID=2689078 RepID=UPI001408B7F7|nr:YheC/YheD family protein [Paenibacillus turpanensis]